MYEGTRSKGAVNPDRACVNEEKNYSDKVTTLLYLKQRDGNNTKQVCITYLIYIFNAILMTKSFFKLTWCLIFETQIGHFQQIIAHAYCFPVWLR